MSGFGVFTGLSIYVYRNRNIICAKKKSQKKPKMVRPL